MKTVKLNDLKKAGKELNKILFEDDAPQIDIKASEEVLTEQIKEAAKLLTKEDVLSDLCKEVVEALAEPKAKASTKAPAEKAAPVKPAKTAEPTLAEQIIGFDDITDLKRLVKAEATFETLRRSIGLEKNLDKLRTKMLALIEETGAEVAKPKAEKATKPAPVKAEKVAKEKKEKAVTAISIIQLETCKNYKITHAQLLDKLHKAGFTNINERYVQMTKDVVLMVVDVLVKLEKLEAYK